MQKTAKRYSERDVAATIERGIVENEMVPGVRLPSASQVAKQFSVSLKTADRALCRLETKGLIRRVRGSGSFVKTNRTLAQRCRVAFVHWLSPDGIPELNYAAFTVFVEQVRRLLGEHGFSYEVFAADLPPHALDIQASLLKYDVIIVPAGMLEIAENFLRNTKQQIILYSDDIVHPGPWNQVVYDYRPAFHTALRYCREKGYRKFFFACGHFVVTHQRRVDACMEEGRKLGFPETAFHVFCSEPGIISSSMLAGTKCARYYMEHKLQDHIIISPSDFITYGMMDVFSSAGMVSGRDYHLISYDNLEGRLENDSLKLNLNSITHPIASHAEAVIALLENLIRNPSRNYYQTYFTPTTEFIIRNTI